jgi:hypothetical protein
MEGDKGVTWPPTRGKAPCWYGTSYSKDQKYLVTIYKFRELSALPVIRDPIYFKVVYVGFTSKRTHRDCDTIIP